MSNPLDFYLINDMYAVESPGLIDGAIGRMGEKGDFKVVGYALTESVLFTPTYGSELIPPEAIIYVHGNMGELNHNFDRSLKLAKQRPDLRLVVGIDPISDQRRFTSQKMYLKYRELQNIDTILMDLEEGSLTLQQMTEITMVCADPLNALVIPRDDPDFPETPAAMQRYLSAHYRARNPK
ncbi:MAG: hypothetical protein WCV90_07995 [Candidatus Woesearchaeota archaeon]